MDNVIRPTFGRRPEPAASVEAHALLRLYGAAAGHCVGLIRADAGPEGETLRIVVGPETGDTVETVGIVPATPEGEADAERTGLAILRALEIVGEADRPDGA